MRVTYLILLVLAGVACCFCYSLGYRAGRKESPLREARQGDLLIAVRTYQAAERTNWSKVQGVLGIQVLALTRDYERRFGVPKGTNRFVRDFAEAKAVANRVEAQLVPLSTALTNLPLSPDFKIELQDER